MQRFCFPTLGLLLMVGLSLGGCRNQQSEEVDTVASTPEVTAESTEPSTPTQTAAPEPTPTKAAPTTDQPYTPINPPQAAILTARQADARINLRSQPTTQSADKGYGLVGDSVTLLRSAPGEGSLTWYYVKFAGSGAEGWIRGDFVDTASPGPAVTTGGGEGFEAEGACSGTLQTRYDSATYMMFICQLRDGGLRYIGRNKSTGDVLITDDVTAIEDGYVAKKGSYEYHLSPGGIVVYQVVDGQYSQLNQESIQSVQSF